jgi:hypothetical protein
LVGAFAGFVAFRLMRAAAFSNVRVMHCDCHDGVPLTVADNPTNRGDAMSPYTTMTWTAKLVIAAMTIALAAGLLEWVVGGMLSADPDSVAARKQTIEAQAERVHQTRALQSGHVYTASLSDDKHL